MYNFDNLPEGERAKSPSRDGGGGGEGSLLIKSNKLGVRAHPGSTRHVVVVVVTAVDVVIIREKKEF